MIQDLQDYLADLQGVEAEYYKSKKSLGRVHIGPFGREAIQQAMEQEKQSNRPRGRFFKKKYVSYNLYLIRYHNLIKQFQNARYIAVVLLF